ncbi:MAG: hypothetical protein ACFB6R_07440 [Alphaproteobacteria bacterium]
MAHGRTQRIRRQLRGGGIDPDDDGGPVVPSLEERRNGWTSESLTAYLRHVEEQIGNRLVRARRAGRDPSRSDRGTYNPLRRRW